MALNTVSLSPSLVKQVEYIAAATGVQADSFVEDAVKHRIEDWHDKLIGQEALAYNKLHATLAQTHLGQHVAILGGEVVDSDLELTVLRQRVLEKHGDLPIFITQVEANPLPIFNAPRPKLRRRH